jgi:hypothetical protein
MSESDYLPVNLAYKERWEDENIPPDVFMQEVGRQTNLLFSVHHIGPGGMQTTITEIDRAQACKRLAALAQHHSYLEQYKRQQLIGNMRVAAKLSQLLADSKDVLRYWVAMLYVQLTFRNPTCCNLLLESDAIKSIGAVLSLGEYQRCQQDNDRGSHDASAHSSPARAKQHTYTVRGHAPVSERTQLACMQVLNNIIGPCPEAINAIAMTEQQEKHRASRDDDGDTQLGMHMSITHVCSDIVRRGRRLPVPLMLAAMQLLGTLIKSDKARKAMIKWNVYKNMRQHCGVASPEGAAAVEIIDTLTVFAALNLQKQMVRCRPHMPRSSVHVYLFVNIACECVCVCCLLIWCDFVCV